MELIFSTDTFCFPIYHFANAPVILRRAIKKLLFSAAEESDSILVFYKNKVSRRITADDSPSKGQMCKDFLKIKVVFLKKAGFMHEEF